MKKIFTILMAVLMVSTVQSVMAQSILLGIQRDSTKVNRKKGGLIQINRIDRAIDKSSFAYKNEWICGVTASYGTLSSDDSDIAMIVENLKFGGSIVSV